MPATIRRGVPADAAALSAIALAAKRHWGYPERWIERWRSQLTIEPGEIAGGLFFVAEELGRAVAFCALSSELEGAWLEHLWVHPSAMGSGLGRALLERALAHAAAQGATAVALEADPHAEPFYLHLGARRTGERVYELDGAPRILPLLEFSLPACGGLP